MSKFYLGGQFSITEKQPSCHTCMLNLTISIIFFILEIWYTSQFVSRMLNHPLPTSLRLDRMAVRSVVIHPSFRNSATWCQTHK